MKKIKLLLTILALSFSLSANADLLPKIVKKNPLTTGVLIGGAIYSNSIIHKSRDLSFNLWKVESYFNTNPQEFNPIANYVLNVLSHPANKVDYDRYHKLAEVMGLDNIPPYVEPNKRNPTVLVNPQIDNNKEDTILENPILEEQFSSIIYSPEGQKFDTSTFFPIEKPLNWKEFINLMVHSQELGRNLDKEMKASNPNWVRPKNVAAHHIIPATDKNAQVARDILKLPDVNIDIDDAVNGVYLPTPGNTNTSGIEHNGKHPKVYTDTVTNLIVDAYNLKGRNGVLNELKNIKNKLQNAPNNSDWSKVL